MNSVQNFASMTETEAYYQLPKLKSKKPTGKSSTSGFEFFKDGLYESKSNVHCFKTDSKRIGIWIYALSQLVYRGQLSQKYDVLWKDNVDSNHHLPGGLSYFWRLICQRTMV